jgi:hypothetical protein
MATDLFDQLSETEVPPPPVEFDQRLHGRLNSTLVFSHVVELMVKAIPFALLHFFQAVGGLLMMSATGRYEVKSKDAD